MHDESRERLTVALGGGQRFCRVRKVRTPEGTVPRKPRAARADGKCHRKETAPLAG
jgi:hypothetical protein